MPEEQLTLLKDRFLTLEILNNTVIDGYNDYKEAIKNDITIINNLTKKSDLKSFEMITLKQASYIAKIYQKHKEIFNKIMNGEYDKIQNISFNIFRLGFGLYYNKKPYLADMNQKLQHYVLKGGAIGLKITNRKFAAECLEHCLQENPKDMEIYEGYVIDEIIKDSNFQKIINQLINDNIGKNKIEGIKQIVTFATGDLALSLHDATLTVTGKKTEKGKWNLEITIFDKYDFTDLKELKEYISNNENYIEDFAGATGNNLAMIAHSCKVVNTYNITIKFRLENLEV